MTKNNFNPYKLREKALCVIESCETQEHSDVASKFVSLVNNHLIKQRQFKFAVELLTELYKKRMSLILKKGE